MMINTSAQYQQAFLQDRQVQEGKRQSKQKREKEQQEIKTETEASVSLDGYTV